MDIYTTASMQRVIERLRTPGNFLLALLFPEVMEFDGEEVDLDRLDEDLRIAPFVAPTVEGQVMSHRGYQTETFKPAYVKPKHSLQPRNMLRRRAGEPRGGNLSPMQRKALALGDTLFTHRGMVDRRLEVMAAEIALTGAVTISGEKYETKNVDFGRAPALTKVLLTTARWGETDVSPHDDIDAWIDEVATTVGAAPNVVVMTRDAWALFVADPKVEKVLDTRRGGTSAIELGFQPGKPGSPVFKGVIGQVEFYVYNDTYENDTGLVVNLLPPYTVQIFATGAFEGVQSFGAILDDDALMAMRLYPKSWVKQDPSHRFVMTQSSPLLVPRRPNASMNVTVR